MLSRILLGFILLPIFSMGFAATPTQQSQVTTSVLNQAEAHYQAFGLTENDWSRYESIMQGTGQYYWPNLDPVTVLGLNARSQEERNRYARILARQEYENSEKLILLDKAYHNAFQELYGHVPIINLTELPAYQDKLMESQASQLGNQVKFGDRFVIFTSTHCAVCDRQVKRVLSDFTLGQSVDIHFKDDSREDITKWAARLSISPDAVNNGTITLNPESDLYQKFGNPEIPSVYFYNGETTNVELIAGSGTRSQ